MWKLSHLCFLLESAHFLQPGNQAGGGVEVSPDTGYPISLSSKAMPLVGQCSLVLVGSWNAV